jgi:hypothetical protein
MRADTKTESEYPEDVRISKQCFCARGRRLVIKATALFADDPDNLISPLLKAAVESATGKTELRWLCKELFSRFGSVFMESDKRQ